MTNIKVSCIQMGISYCSKEENIEKALQMAADAVRIDAKLIVFPEAFSTGFCYNNLDSVAEESSSMKTEDYPTIKKLLEFSIAHDCVLIGSIIEKKIDDGTARYYNMGFCIESGQIAGIYRKTHLYGMEKTHFSGGKEILPIILKKSGITIGLQICYELRFPEISRKLALAGADILVTVAEFANPKSSQWKSLVAARAIENQIPHVACNRIGNAPFASYFGNSMIVNAWGYVKAEAGDEECFITWEIDMAETKRIRGKVPIYDDRQIELY